MRWLSKGAEGAFLKGFDRKRAAHYTITHQRLVCCHIIIHHPSRFFWSRQVATFTTTSAEPVTTVTVLRLGVVHAVLAEVLAVNRQSIPRVLVGTQLIGVSSSDVASSRSGEFDARNTAHHHVSSSTSQGSDDLRLKLARAEETALRLRAQVIAHTHVHTGRLNAHIFSFVLNEKLKSYSDYACDYFLGCDAHEKPVGQPGGSPEQD